jgi:hypothetical protein
MVKTAGWVPTAMDRCDSGNCSAQAYVKAAGVTGELLFCNHHYEEIMSDPSGYENMMRFAFEVVDERERLIENRLKGDDK